MTEGYNAEWSGNEIFRGILSDLLYGLTMGIIQTVTAYAEFIR